MKWWEVVLCIISIVFCYYAHAITYKRIFGQNIKNIELNKTIIFLLLTVSAYYNTFYNYDFSKIFINFFIMYFFLALIFREPVKDLLFKILLIYFIGFLIETLLGLFMVYFKYSSLLQINDNVIFKVLFSTLMMLILILLSKSDFIIKICGKLYSLMNKIFNMFFLIAISVFILALLTYYLILSIDVYSIVAIIFLIIILLSLIIITIFMKEYEMIIDKERIDRHEMVNNLLVLKSIKNKNSKNYNKLLDDILLAYQSNKTPKGLYELPSGLKGLFYYKIHDMKSNNIEPFVNVSNKIIKDLDNLDSKTLTKLCKILGILLDNAKEAAKESKEKLVVIDLYKENKDIVVYIENSINKNMEVDLSNIKVKGFSTKGNNRGYGLYLVDKILNKTDEMELIQKINNKKFISILTIKK